MRSRIGLVGAAMAAGSLVIGVGSAAAATKHTAAQTAKPSVLKCKISMTTVPPTDSNVVLVAPDGSQYGSSRCARKGFGPGVIASSFTVPDSGDTVGTFSEYFAKGSISGKFDLAPLEGTGISDTTFAAETLTGTVTVTGGTGIYKGLTRVKGKKGIGTMNCASPDSVHLACTDSVKVVLPANFTP